MRGCASPTKHPTTTSPVGVQPSAGAERALLLSDTLRGLDVVDDVITLIEQYSRQAKMVIVGGQRFYRGQSIHRQSIHCYDPSTDTWTVLGAQLAQYDREAGAAGLTVLGTDLLSVGGRPHETSVATRLSLETGVLHRDMEPLPTSRSFCMAATVGCNIFVFSQLFAGHHILRYNTITRTWDERTAGLNVIPTSLAVLRGAVYIVNSTGWVKRYDTETDICSDVPPPTSNRRGCTVAGDDRMNCLYLCGSSNSRSCERYWPALNKWQTIRDMPSRREDAMAACIDGRIYVCGGLMGPHPHTAVRMDVECYDPLTCEWTMVAPMPEPRMEATALVVVGL
jgi:hypothetical protein